eukprot:TRINITY_DN103204_c0_g1_i1.p1 TRINITY_DN103204_c0_g1~~TRINITY_DN103204_c0_g1_i1.p1  ORF type:complete len:234 (-),score=37.96 TRINITY_DN103204_c0_g1_i1:18-683(-)
MASAGELDGQCQDFGVPALRQRSLDLLARCVADASRLSLEDARGLEAAWLNIVAGRCALELEFAAWSWAHASATPSTGVTDHASCALRVYRGKVRFLATTLKRPETFPLFGKLRDGEVKACELVAWPEEEFLGEARRRERLEHQEEAFRAVYIKDQSLDYFDDRLACPKCFTTGVSYAVLRDSWALPRAGGCMGHMRRDTGKCILAECPACKERWQQDGIV